MNLPPTTCHYCDQPAVVLCDYVVANRGQPGRLEAVTCDRALCADHRRKVGHVCDRARRTKNNLSDTIDHCKEHYEPAADLPR